MATVAYARIATTPLDIGNGAITNQIDSTSALGFDSNIPVWTEKLASLKTDAPEILEIGAYEGRSTLFFLSHLPGCRVTVIDAWGIATEHSQHPILSAVEERFDANIRDYAERVTKMRGRSGELLGKLLGKRNFDLVYVDGSHYADDVMVDAMLSWMLLRQSGLIIFDDYVWIGPHGPKKSSCRAINLFLRLIKGEYHLEHAGHQLIVRKIRSLREIATEA